VTAPEWLTALGIPEECISDVTSVTERTRRFSIRPRRGSGEDQIWCVQVDGCWIDDTVKKVDYLLVGQSASGRKVIVLVELKGQDFGKALEQIESTLQFFCKQSPDNIIHRGLHRDSQGHDAPGRGGVRAHVVLSRGKSVPQRAHRREKIRKRYGVIVYTHKQDAQFDGLDSLFS
jgi:hypothetical protein